MAETLSATKSGDGGLQGLYEAGDMDLRRIYGVGLE